MVVLKSEENMTEMSVMLIIFSNDESPRPPTLLVTEPTTDILVGQIDNFQKSRFKGHL